VHSEFPGTEVYWENRYSSGGTSGAGSYGRLAIFKAKILNEFVIKHNIRSIVEFGCGDGNQLKLANYPQYTGFDVSQTALDLCQQTFSSDRTKCFLLLDKYKGQQAELGLSLDVIFHLIEDVTFEAYMRRLFQSSQRFVIIYSSNNDDNRHSAPHVRHRIFTRWVKNNCTDWTLIDHVPNKFPGSGNDPTSSFASFFFYARDLVT
jgi:hypothetical protein